MKRDSKDLMILILILVVTFMSGALVFVSNNNNNSLRTSMQTEDKNVEITKIVSVATEGYAEDMRSYIDEKLKAVVYPKVVNKYDRIVYTFNVKNNGKTSVELRGINISPKIGEHLLYTLSNIEAGDILEKGESRVFSVIISYDNEYELESVEYVELPVNITLDFVQR